MRTKENADDYRYFPDPDLVPLVLDAALLERVKGSLPELPESRRARFEAEYGLSAYDARLLTGSRALAELFEGATRALGDAKSVAHGDAKSVAHGDAKSVAHGNAKSVANWIARDVQAALKERELEIESSKLGPEALAALVRLVDDGKVTAKSARELLPDLVERGGDPLALVRERGLEAVSDTGAIEAAADEVIAANPDNAARYRAGEEKILNFLMGQVMKKTGGKASPAAVREVLARKLKA
jgi:aspartyl-tRNA(Asn)/glutamyl-tRNA(Gln) amidotransferase subunit B